MIGDIFTQAVALLTGLVNAGSTVADGALDFIGTGSTGAEEGAGAVIGSLGNIFN